MFDRSEEDRDCVHSDVHDLTIQPMHMLITFPPVPKYGNKRMENWTDSYVQRERVVLWLVLEDTFERRAMEGYKPGLPILPEAFFTAISCRVGS